MKILIAIPSKKRAEVLRKNALAWVRLTGIDFAVFVELEDLKDYREMFQKEQVPLKIVCLNESSKGLGYSKVSIKKYADANGYDVIVKIDDDVSGWTDFRTKLTPQQSAEKFKFILSESIDLFNKNPDVVCVSFPYSFQMFEQKDFKKDKRVQTAYIARTEYFHADPRISAFEDFAVGLNAIVKQKLVMKYGMSGICMGVQVGKGEGGHQSYNRERQAYSEIDVLREIYPPLKFRKVDKIWHYEPDLRSVKVGQYS